ncbi:hypothetical protein BJ165DRAFT_770412 [Panaeolus papilionaceus]|nr:hypothetical protein BJ165DRAFT_770412 [Panaeolus papilionaceus]
MLECRIGIWVGVDGCQLARGELRVQRVGRVRNWVAKNVGMMGHVDIRILIITHGLPSWRSV